LNFECDGANEFALPRMVKIVFPKKLSEIPKRDY